MPTALMSLGTNKFYVPLPDYDTPGFETLMRDTTYTWVPQGRLNKPLAMQYTGPGDDVVVLSGRLFPHQFGGISTIANLRNAGKAGKPLLLLRYYELSTPSGMAGDVLGNYVIRRVRTLENKIGTSGMAHKIEFELELSAYSPDVERGDQPISYA
ncbi:phage tail protein [Methylobacterium ajmalii]|uniref:Phage tail protein n=1 Tax=Methylobacterium ajmalii TaxID=2738439 RepID=A0ABV0A4Z8_9HYPH